MDTHAQVPASEASLTLDYLLRRMRQKPDFPALAESVSRIQALSHADHESLARVCDEILKDLAFTQKLLRLVNAARYRHAGADPVSTVSRAVMLMGLGGVRNVALSMALVDHMPDKAHARHLRAGFLKAVMAGAVARELCPDPRWAEEAFLAGLMRHLGRLLVAYYLPEDEAQVQARWQAAQAAGEVTTLDAVSRQVLGVSFDDLGVAVGAQWGLAPALLTRMKSPDGAWPAHRLHHEDQALTWLASLGDGVADALMEAEPAERGQALQTLERQASAALGLKPDAVSQAAHKARSHLKDMLDALEMELAPDEPAHRLVESYYVDEPNPEVGQRVDPAALGLVEPPRAEPMPPHDPMACLQQGLQDAASMLVGDCKLQDVLQVVLETLLRAFECQRVVFCLRDARTGALVGRVALGHEAEALKGWFQIPLNAQGPLHLMSAACLKGVDTLIQDARQPQLQDRLPLWFRERVGAPTFLLLPLVMNRGGQKMVMGLIYADKAAAGSLQPTPAELGLVNALRNQAIMAFQQAGGRSGA
jgi:HD-like signal output (HDOD) protein